MGKIPNQRSKPKKFGMENIQKKLIEKKLKNPLIKMKRDLKLTRCIFTELFAGGSDPSHYVRIRGYTEYNNMIKYLHLGGELKNKTILYILREYANKNNKKIIKVLDDGAGRGVFLTSLKEMWATFVKNDPTSPKLKTTAIVLDENDLHKAKMDNVFVGDVCDYIPKEKFDFIFSVFGGFAHSTPQLQREILLKHLYSLEKGGYGFFGFFSEHKKEYTDIFTRKLNQMGFDAKYYTFKQENNPGINSIIIKENLPKEYLVVKRIK